jgi:hypothetical protein
MKSFFRILLLISWILLFASCSGTSTQISKYLHQGTVESEPLYKAIEKSNELVSDGILSLTIEEREAKCHHINDMISINLVFENLTCRPLVLQSRFTISKKRFGTDGDIFVWLNAQDRTPLLSPTDGVIDELWGQTPTPSKYQVLGAFFKFETKFDYKLPHYVRDGNAQNKYNFFTPSPGQYLIRIIYQNLIPSQINEWSGVIASNQVEVCVIE